MSSPPAAKRLKVATGRLRNATLPNCCSSHHLLGAKEKRRMQQANSGILAIPEALLCHIAQFLKPLHVLSLASSSFELFQQLTSAALPHFKTWDLADAEVRACTHTDKDAYTDTPLPSLSGQERIGS
jgi:hypothetical protein